MAEKQVKRTITSQEAGSVHGVDPQSEFYGQVKSTPAAVPGEYPTYAGVDYSDSDDAWKRAYDHAAGRNNTVKAAILYADNHSQDFEEEPAPRGTSKK